MNGINGMLLPHSEVIRNNEDRTQSFLHYINQIEELGIKLVVKKKNGRCVQIPTRKNTYESKFHFQVPPTFVEEIVKKESFIGDDLLNFFLKFCNQINANVYDDPSYLFYLGNNILYPKQSIHIYSIDEVAVYIPQKNEENAEEFTEGREEFIKKAADKDCLIFPWFEIETNHFIVIVLSLTTQTLIVFDSVIKARRTYEPIVNQIVEFCIKIKVIDDVSKWKFVYPDPFVAQQSKSGNDCGAFLAMICYFFAHNISPLAIKDANEILSFRYFINYILWPGNK